MYFIKDWSFLLLLTLVGKLLGKLSIEKGLKSWEIQEINVILGSSQGYSLIFWVNEAAILR